MAAAAEMETEMGVKRNGSRARSVTVAECIRPACAVNLIRAQHEAHGPTTGGVASEFRVILVSSQIVRLLQVSTSEHTSCTSSNLKKHRPRPHPILGNLKSGQRVHHQLTPAHCTSTSTMHGLIPDWQKEDSSLELNLTLYSC